MLARYDMEHAGRLGEKAREKEAKIRWALRQPRMAIEQLPLAWQQEAYDRYDELEGEAAAHRRRIERGRDAVLVNPGDGARSEVTL